MSSKNLLERAREYRKAGKFQEALVLIEDVLSELHTDDRTDLIECYNEKSQCLWRTGKILEAEQYAQTSLQLSDQDPIYILGKADACYNLSAVADERGNLDRAE